MFYLPLPSASFPGSPSMARTGREPWNKATSPIPLNCCVLCFTGSTGEHRECPQQIWLEGMYDWSCMFLVYHVLTFSLRLPSLPPFLLTSFPISLSSSRMLLMTKVHLGVKPVEEQVSVNWETLQFPVCVYTLRSVSIFQRCTWTTELWS